MVKRGQISLLLVGASSIRRNTRHGLAPRDDGASPSAAGWRLPRNKNNYRQRPVRGGDYSNQVRL